MIRRRLLAPLLAALLLASCAENSDPATPEGAFNEFRNALLSENESAMWEALSTDTRALFEDALASLRLMKASIQRLPQSDREKATRQTGVALLDRITTAEQLFSYMYAQERAPMETAYREGLAIDRIEIIDDTHARVLSRAGQTFELVREDDGVWRITSPMQEIFASAFDKVQANRANLERAVILYATDDDDEALRRLLGGPRPPEPTPAPTEGTGE